jgi:hypothetical protein
MSNGTLTTTELPQNQVLALRREINRMIHKHVGETPIAFESIDPATLGEGQYTRTELRRLQAMMVKEMLDAGVGVPAIRRRLNLTKGACDHLILHGYADFLSEVTPEVRRAIVASQIEWDMQYATQQLEQTGKIDWFRERRELRREESKLLGLNMPERQEIETTQHIAVQFEVIRDREQLQRAMADEQETPVSLKVANNMDPLLEDATDDTPPD